MTQKRSVSGERVQIVSKIKWCGHDTDKISRWGNQKRKEVTRYKQPFYSDAAAEQRPRYWGAQQDGIIERSGARRRKKEICCIETKLTANRRTKREREQKWAETWVHLSKRREAQREEKEQKGYDTAEQLRKLSYFGEAVVYSGSDNLTSPAPPHPSSYSRKKESVCNSLSLLSFTWPSFHQTAAEPQIMVQIASFVTFMVMCHIIIKMCHKVSQRGLQGCRLQEWNTENGQRRWCWFFS